MKRRLFLKQTGIATTGVLLFSGAEVTAHDLADIPSKNRIDLSPISFVANKVTLTGLILDSETQQIISTCQIKVKIKNNRLLSNTEEIKVTNGSYEVLTGFTNSCRIRKKLEVQITAEGYKPYQGSIFISHKGCNIHSDEWVYNQDFNTNQCPQNVVSGNKTTSQYNFFLVKK